MISATVCLTLLASAAGGSSPAESANSCIRPPQQQLYSDTATRSLTWDGSCGWGLFIPDAQEALDLALDLLLCIFERIVQDVESTGESPTEHLLCSVRSLSSEWSTAPLSAQPTGSLLACLGPPLPTAASERVVRVSE